MFVSKSKYEREQIRRLQTELAYIELRNKWNDLIDRVNAKGGEDFLNGISTSNKPSFTKKEVDTLIRLCHPDKHSGKKSANDITSRLIMVRKTL